jgi:predicted O-linked N-acetylglucosamine transferase (SPINDLY family)
VFVRTQPVSELRDRLAAVGVACISLEKDVAGLPEPDFHALLALRERVSAAQISAVVWVSIAIHMAFAFSMRVAPVQIWWAMKYHSLELPEIDGYLTNQSAGSTKLVEGKLWRSAPLASEDWYRPQLAGQAIEVRAGYPQHALLFGCIGREEKINSAPFLAAVATILEACPNAGFLWTGRERSPAVQSALERAGVAERCHFIGWVDTKLYAQVLDIFLDSFPFPCGFTLYEAMAAGKPVVIYGSAEAAETGIYGLLGPLLSGAVGTPQEGQAANKIFANGKLFHCAHNQQHYIELALKLASDPSARRAAGDANRSFVREFLSDRAAMARAVGRHLVELVQNKRSA